LADAPDDVSSVKLRTRVVWANDSNEGSRRCASAHSRIV